MLCTEEMGTLLSRYVDGELAERERKSIETHLETCASCRDVLNLFQRNDNVLNNALVGETFGAQTVEAVMTEIRRLEEPVVVAPAVEEEAPPGPPAMRQVLQVTRMWPFAAAAALMIACLGGFLAVAQYGGFGSTERAVLEKQLAANRQIGAESQEAFQKTAQVMIDRVRDVSQEIRDLEVRTRLQASQNTVGLAYVNGRSIVVQANYPSDKFYPFQVLRAREVEPGRFENWKWISLDLPTPYFRDDSAEPGVNYMYQIRAIYRNSNLKEYVDSPAMLQMLPLAGGLNPRRSLRIRFIAAHPDLSQATFEVSRYENEKLISRYYNVKPGDLIGEVETIDGKEISFATRYSLQSVAKAEEIIGGGSIVVPVLTRRASLKADHKAKDLPIESFSLLLEGDQYVPLPK